KNSLPPTSIGPARNTRAVSAIEASQVRRLTAMLIREAMARSPIAASSSAPARGKASTAKVSIIRQLPPHSRPRPSFGFLQLFEVLQVEAVELLADLEKEHAEDQ